MNLKCCWTDTIVIVYLIMYNIYITITIIYVIFWMYRHKPLSLYLQLQLQFRLVKLPILFCYVEAIIDLQGLVACLNFCNLFPHDSPVVNALQNGDFWKLFNFCAWPLLRLHNVYTVTKLH